MKPNEKNRRPDSSHDRPELDSNLARALPRGEPFLPHERDEAPGTQPPESAETKGPRETIKQAEDDVNRGLRDTDLRGIPSNVPGPRGSRQNGETNAAKSSHEDAADDEARTRAKRNDKVDS